MTTRWRYELLAETLGVIWNDTYLEGHCTLEEANEMNDNTLLVAGWSQEEYDRETIDRYADEPGCRRNREAN